MKYYVKIICENEHTYKLLKEFAKDKGYDITTFLISNEIFVLAEDFCVASKIYDEIAKVDDMWSDIKILEMSIEDLS